MLEATALPTEPQPLPKIKLYLGCLSWWSASRGLSRIQNISTKGWTCITSSTFVVGYLPNSWFACPAITRSMVQIRVSPLLCKTVVIKKILLSGRPSLTIVCKVWKTSVPKMPAIAKVGRVGWYSYISISPPF